jgi:hypothetical protein
MAKWLGDASYDRYMRPAGPPTQRGINMRGIEEAWLRWSFLFGRDMAVGASPPDRFWRARPDYPSLPEVGLCMVLPRRGQSNQTKHSSSSAALVPGVFKELPELWAFLTASTFPDGAKRKTGRLSFSCDAGNVVLSLNDPESNQYVTLSGRNVQELLETAELKMVADELDWRRSKFGK